MEKAEDWSLAGASDSDRRGRMLGERMFLQLQSEDEAAVSVCLAHIGNEVSQGVDYDVVFGNPWYVVPSVE